MALCTAASALTTVFVVRFSGTAGSRTSSGVRPALNMLSQPRATIKRGVLIVMVALAHFALTLGAVAVALSFMREPACSADDDCDCIDDCRTVVFKVDAAPIAYGRSAV